MLITEETTAINPRTSRDEFIITPTLAEPFEQASPTWEELRAWSMDPAILSRLQSDGPLTIERLEDLGRLDLSELPALVGLRCVDWARAQASRVLPMASRIGLIRTEDIGALTATAHGIIGTLTSIRDVDPGLLSEEIAKRAIFDFYAMTSAQIAASSPYAALAVQVIDFSSQFVSSIVAMRKGDASAARARLPLLTVRDVSDSGRVEETWSAMDSSRDWSALAMPTTAGDWHLYEVGEKRPGDQGFAMARSMGEGGWTAAGGMGYMPGTERCQGFLQWTSIWRSVRDLYDDRRDKQGRPLPPTANWGSHRCDPSTQKKGKSGAPCFQSPETFSGGSNCRQCIPVRSWQGGRGDWEEISNAYSSSVVNTADWTVNSTQSLTALWRSLTLTNPSTWCFDVEAIQESWRDYWGSFFEFIGSSWEAHDAYPWRALLSHFGAMGLVSLEDGEIGGLGTMLDWRVRGWGDYQGISQPGETPGVGVAYSGCPTDPDARAAMTEAGLLCPGLADVKALRYITPTFFLWRNSIFERAIFPACQQLAATQLAGYQTTMVAYLWQEQGAHWDADAKRVRDNVFGRAYEDGLAALLSSPARLRSVHMHHVVDPKVRQLLLDAGVEKHQIGGVVLAPDVGSRPANRPPRMGSNPIVPIVSAWTRPPRQLPPVGGLPGATEPEPVTSGGGGAAVGAAALAAAAAFAFLRWR